MRRIPPVARVLQMNVAGARAIAAPRALVWHALLDPVLLAQALPGCRSLIETGAGAYDLLIEMGVGSIKGSYAGTVRIEDSAEPRAYTMRIDANGKMGFVNATARITLEETSPDQTDLRYDADAAVGGLVAGVGQRMLGGVAKLVIDQFFKNLQLQLMKAQA
jgi:carbon monoxide dehydrogenase subunit G